MRMRWLMGGVVGLGISVGLVAGARAEVLGDAYVQGNLAVNGQTALRDLHVQGFAAFGGPVSIDSELRISGVNSLHFITYGGRARVIADAPELQFASSGSLIFSAGYRDRMVVDPVGNVLIGPTPGTQAEAGSGYLQLTKTVYGWPPLADCSLDEHRGRLVMDTQRNRLFVCNGKIRGWDYIRLLGQ